MGQIQSGWVFYLPGDLNKHLRCIPEPLGTLRVAKLQPSGYTHFVDLLTSVLRGLIHVCPKIFGCASLQLALGPSPFPYSYPQPHPSPSHQQGAVLHTMERPELRHSLQQAL